MGMWHRSIAEHTPEVDRNRPNGFAPIRQIWISLLALLAFSLYRFSIPWEISFMVRTGLVSYPFTELYGASAILLLVLFAFHRLFFDANLRFFGNPRLSEMLIGLLAVTAVYLATYGIDFLLGIPREGTMVRLYYGMSEKQIVVMVISMLALPPIVEELAFRHFLLFVFPFRADGRIALLAVMFTGAFFSYAHHEVYQNPTTFIEIFVALLKTQWVMRLSGHAR